MGIEEKRTILQKLGRTPTEGEAAAMATEAKLERVMSRLVHVVAYLPLAAALIVAVWFCVLHYLRGRHFEADGPLTFVGYTFTYAGVMIGVWILEMLILVVFRDILRRKARWWAIGLHLGLVLVTIAVGPGMAWMFHRGRQAAWRAIDVPALASAATGLPARIPSGEPAVTLMEGSSEYDALPAAVREKLAPTKVKITPKAAVFQKVGTSSYDDSSDGLIVPLVPLSGSPAGFAQAHELQVLSESPPVFRYTGTDLEALHIPELDLTGEGMMFR